MRILYPVSEPLTGPKARFIQIISTCHALAQCGCHVTIITGKTTTPIAELLKKSGLPHVQGLCINNVPMLYGTKAIPLKLSCNLVFHIACLIKTIRLLALSKYDALYIRHLKLADFLLRFKKFIPIPVIFEIHELFFATAKAGADKKRNMENRVYSGVDALVTTNDSLTHTLKKSFSINNKPVVVIRNGVKQGIIEHFKNKKLIGSGVICYVGQLYPWKGVDRLIRAMSLVKGGALNIIGGSGPLFDDMKRLARDTGVSDRIVFHGQVPHGCVDALLMEAEITVLPLPSSQDALFTSPLKLFEYMAAKTAIIASDIPVLREILTHEVNAILVKPDDLYSLAQGINRLLSDNGLATRLAERAYENVRCYTWEERAKKIINLVNSLSENKHGVSLRHAFQQ